MRTALPALMSAALLIGCAGAGEDVADRGGPRPERSDDQPAQRDASLFVSPSGEPFRARAGEAYPVDQWFKHADKNADGRLDRAEFRADAEAFFRLLDRNHDGVIDGFEIAAYEQTVAPEIMGAYGADSAPRPSGRNRGDARRGPVGADAAAAVLGGGAVFSLLSEPEPVASADLALDNHITLAEFLLVADRRFDRLDVKRLGFLTLIDLPKTTAQALTKGRSRKP